MSSPSQVPEQAQKELAYEQQEQQQGQSAPTSPLQSMNLNPATLSPEQESIVKELLAQAPPGQFPTIHSLLQTITNCSFEDSLLQQDLLNGLLITESNPNEEAETDVKKIHLLTTDNYLEGLLVCNDGRKLTLNLADKTASDKAVEQETDKDDEAVEQEAKSPKLETEETTTEDSVDEFAKELKAQLQSYLQEFYPQNGHFSLVKQQESTYKLHILARKLNHQNYWGVEWHSQWTFTPNELCSGGASLTAHYFEDGNVQLKAEKNLHGSISFAKPADLVQKIRDFEDALQLQLNDSYQQLGDVSFKRLRRQLPVTRQKMDWAKCATYKLKTELENNWKRRRQIKP